MGIIAWIVLGLGAGLLANMLIPGRRSQGLILTCVIGIAGALETGIQAVWLSPYRADLPARRPVRLGSGCRFPGMLLSPVTFRITGQPSDPKTPPPVHARYAGYIAVRLVAHAEHPVPARPGWPARPWIRRAYRRISRDGRGPAHSRCV
jgi:hypothetical protein